MSPRSCQRGANNWGGDAANIPPHDTRRLILMQPDSTRKKPLSGFQRSQARVAAGLPRYTDAELRSRRANTARRGERRWVEYGARLAALKVERGCADCGYNAHPAALDFDHLPGAEKVAGLSTLANAAWARVLEEIAKCEVVCANCHRIRTANRRVRKLA